MLPILTGKRVNDEQFDMKKELDFEYGNIFYDSFPLIWKLFSGKGYATVLNEDRPEWGLFNYVSKGFTNNPVAFRYRPFWLAIKEAINENHSDWCFANVPRPYLLTDITKRHLVTMNDSLQFIYTHYVECCHNQDNELEKLDEHLMSFFKEMYNGNYFNKTIIIFAADHGLRFGDILETTVGRLEERLPFYSLWFPSWFYTLHPHIEKSLNGNKNILSTNFDVYETLKDIFNANYDDRQRRNDSRGQSQLYPLPKHRTCRSAGIPDHYCTCIKEKPLLVAHQAAKESAAALVNHLNEILKNHSDICQKINLTQIVSAVELEIDEKIKKDVFYNEKHKYKSEENSATSKSAESGKEHTVDAIRIGILTEPFGGRFEALLKNITVHNRTSWLVDSVVSRISKYGGYANCIKDKHLEKYCSCKNIKR